tara:strand:- start:729 stop:1472 length:744 start_codon:yes stop_codon:yes gene_type:complete
MSIIRDSKKIKAEQNFKEFYSRYFTGIFSPYLAAVFVGTRITPNQLTLAMIPCGIIGTILMISGNSLLALLGSLCYIFLNVLDASDGELARYTNQTSVFGDYLDRVAHYITNSAFMLGLGFFIYFQNENILFIYLIVLGEVFMLGDEVLRDLLISCGLQDLKNNDPGTRKNQKKLTKIKANTLTTILFNVFFSNAAAFHITPLLLMLFHFNLINLFVLGVYFFLFSIIYPIKFLMRYRSIATEFQGV